MGLPLVISARMNENDAVKSITTMSLLGISCIEHSMTIDAIGMVDAMVVATILEIARPVSTALYSGRSLRLWVSLMFVSCDKVII